MSLDVLKAYVKGYGDRMLDNQIIALQSGYWSAYYVGAKHPKPVHKITEDLMRRHQAQDAKNLSTPKPDVDVEAFLEMEAQFNARLKQQGGEP
jgi:hypothetical protein